ncbi:MAG: hypothetical protein KBF93_14415 [Leptospiraceae bacterium]|nr:hypothetical protein [Leptospiraceae bacterium]
MNPSDANRNSKNNILTEKERNLYQRGLKILYAELGLEFLSFLEIVIKMNKEK